MADLAFSNLWLDHVGLVVEDVAPVVAQLREAGFSVSDPVALQGENGPLGQTSAHCVFENFYLEISAPVPGSGNHLEPLLAEGPGVKIIALGCEDADAAHAKLSESGVACGPLRDASREVMFARRRAIARFRWFAVEEGPAGAITALVEHLDPEIVFAPELSAHRNGSRRVTEVVLGEAGRSLRKLAQGKATDAPAIRIDESELSIVRGLVIDGTIFPMLDVRGLTLQSSYQIEVPHP